VSDDPAFRPETLSTWEPPDDFAVVREALYQLPLVHQSGSQPALNRIEWRMRKLARERDEALRAEDVAERHREAAEARLERIEAAAIALRDAEYDHGLGSAHPDQDAVDAAEEAFWGLIPDETKEEE